MGLLDDAIREHLDLMRARGGDPAEVERMEREALGPVRREPTIGSARAEAVGEHAPAAQDDHLADLEELQERGYHDSSAPHAHHRPADGRFGLGNGDSYAEEPEQPRRRFLRRNRSTPDAALPDRGFGRDETEFDPLDPNGLGDHDPLGHDDPFAEHDSLEQHEPLAHVEPPVEPLAHDEPPFAAHEPREHDEALENDELLEHDEALEHPTAQEQAPDTLRPPHLQFENPPKRPRFTAEPPELHDASAAADAPLPPEAEADTGLEVQETTEFDVQKHIAETRHQPDEAPPVAPVPPADAAPPVAPTPPVAPAPAVAPPAPPAAPAPPAGELPEEDEDVLEETPEFLQDTPEHDRLWFEQRPPKDFDFDG